MQKRVREITSRKKGHAKERYWTENFENTIYYSDTSAAAEYIEKHGDFEKYVSMYGMSVQEYVRSEVSAAEYDHRAMRCVFDPNGTMLIGDDL